jgi:hypothetical protein
MTRQMNREGQTWKRYWVAETQSWTGEVRPSPVRKLYIKEEYGSAARRIQRKQLFVQHLTTQQWLSDPTEMASAAAATLNKSRKPSTKVKGECLAHGRTRTCGQSPNKSRKPSTKVKGDCLAHGRTRTCGQSPNKSRSSDRDVDRVVAFCSSELGPGMLSTI